MYTRIHALRQWLFLSPEPPFPLINLAEDRNLAHPTPLGN